MAKTTEMHGLLFLEARNLRSRCPQSWFLLRALFQACLLALKVSAFYLYLSTLSSFCACLCVQISPFNKDISQTVLGPTLRASP